MANKTAANKTAAKKAAPKSAVKNAAKNTAAKKQVGTTASKKAAMKPAKAAPKSTVSAMKNAKTNTNVKANTKAKALAASPSKAVNQVAAKSAAKMSGAVRGMTRFNPLDDRIVIERVMAPEKTAGGLYIPDSAQEKPTLGKVVAVGRGHRDAKGRTRPCDVKVGDQVLFTAWSGSEIEVEGVSYVIMRESDLLGVTNA